MLHHFAPSSSAAAANFFTSGHPGGGGGSSRLPLAAAVKAHRRFPADEGSSSWSSDVVEANMNILKNRIHELQIKERLSPPSPPPEYPTGHRRIPFSQLTTRPLPTTTSNSSPTNIKPRVQNNYGWNHADCSMIKSRRQRRRHGGAGGELVLQLFRALTTVGITCLSGTCLLCLVSILTHDFSHQF
ncbi:hypothetical protein LINPERHAP1_LOCUS40130 [Linum perenne]